MIKINETATYVILVSAIVFTIVSPLIIQSISYGIESSISSIIQQRRDAHDSYISKISNMCDGVGTSTSEEHDCIKDAIQQLKGLR